MTTQLDEPETRFVPDTARASRGPDAGSRPAAARPPVKPLGPDRGLGLLYWFAVATAVMVGAVLVASAVGRMWILVPVMVVHLSMTFFVLSAIVRLMARGK